MLGIIVGSDDETYGVFDATFGLRLGFQVGFMLGNEVAVKATFVGGWFDVFELGKKDGDLEGEQDGALLGFMDGIIVGSFDGRTLGKKVGFVTGLVEDGFVDGIEEELESVTSSKSV